MFGQLERAGGLDAEQADVPEILNHPQIAEIKHGYLLVTTDEYTIEVHRQIYNWRLLVFLRSDPMSGGVRGYCFFGRDLESLARAVAAGFEWEDPLHSDPPDWDKRAFPSPAYREPELFQP